ncbi:MAG TPA: L,D-transpeptidase [Acidimicrobiales bacterium]
MLSRPARSARRARTTLVLVVGVLLGAACTGERPELAAQAETTSSSVDGQPQGSEPIQVAQAKGDAIDVFPDATAEAPAQQLAASAVTSAPGIPLVLLVVQTGDDRIEVYLPTAPAGTTGWVRRDDVSRSTVGYRIEIAQSEHRIRVRDGAEVVLDEPAGLGPDRPDPSAGLFLRELVQPPDRDGPYGTYVYGLAGAPNVRDGLAEGRGVIGIHGTDDPAEIGTEMDDGSIALSAAVLDRLVDELGLPLGTPVTILP